LAFCKRGFNRQFIISTPKADFAPAAAQLLKVSRCRSRYPARFSFRQYISQAFQGIIFVVGGCPCRMQAPLQVQHLSAACVVLVLSKSGRMSSFSPIRHWVKILLPVIHPILGGAVVDCPFKFDICVFQALLNNETASIGISCGLT
jgi:hypothetical protein